MKIYKIIIYFSLLFIFVSTQLMSPLNSVVLYAKHFSLFLLLALFSYDLVTLVTKHLINQYQLRGVKETIVHVGRVLTFTILTLSISHFQYRYIYLIDVPYTMGCKYYDRYNHLIYQSQFALACPNLTIIENSEYVLVFEVRETNQSNNRGKYHIDQDQYILNPTINTERLSTVSIQYDEHNKIQSVDYQLSLRNHASSERDDDHIQYFSYHKIIENKVNHSSFEQVVLTAHGVYHPNTNDLQHHTFKSTDYDSVRYYTISSSDASKESMYYLMKEETFKGSETRIEAVATIDYQSQSDNFTVYSIKVHDHLAMIDSKVIYITKNKQDITYSINEVDKTGDVQQLNLIFKSNFDVDHLISSNEIFNQSNDSTTTHLIHNYSFIQDIRDQNYLLSKDDKANSYTNGKEIRSDEMIYQIKNTEYGSRVAHMKRREYAGMGFNISLNGEIVSEDYYVSYFNWHPDSYVLFDLEYQLNGQEDHIFYSELPFLLTK